MNKTFNSGLFKDYYDFGARLEAHLTQQLVKTDDLKDENEKLALKVRLHKEKNQKLEDEKKARDEEFKQITAQLAEKTFQCEKLQESNNILSQKLENMSEEIKKLNASLTQKVTECDQLAVAKGMLEEELQNYSRQNSDLLKKNEALREEAKKEKIALMEQVCELLSKNSELEKNMAKSSHKEECSSTSTDPERDLKEKTPQNRSNLPTSLVISSDEELEKPAKKPKRQEKTSGSKRKMEDTRVIRSKEEELPRKNAKLVSPDCQSFRRKVYSKKLERIVVGKTPYEKSVLFFSQKSNTKD